MFGVKLQHQASDAPDFLAGRGLLQEGQCRSRSTTWQLLFATLSALNPAFGGITRSVINLGQYNTEISGLPPHRRGRSAQTTLTKVFGPHFGQPVKITSSAKSAASGPISDQSVLRFDGPRYLHRRDSTIRDGQHRQRRLPRHSLQVLPSNFSWGYQLAAKMDFKQRVLPA